MSTSASSADTGGGKQIKRTMSSFIIVQTLREATLMFDVCLMRFIVYFFVGAEHEIYRAKKASEDSVTLETSQTTA